MHLTLMLDPVEMFNHKIDSVPIFCTLAPTPYLSNNFMPQFKTLFPLTTASMNALKTGPLVPTLIALLTMCTILYDQKLERVGVPSKPSKIVTLWKNQALQLHNKSCYYTTMRIIKHTFKIAVLLFDMKCSTIKLTTKGTLMRMTRSSSPPTERSRLKK